MDEMGFESYKHDPDVWFRSSFNDEGANYYQYVFLYTNDILAIIQNLEGFIPHKLGKIFVVKTKSIVTPTQYLGHKVSYVTLENGRNELIFS